MVARTGVCNGLISVRHIMVLCWLFGWRKCKPMQRVCCVTAACWYVLYAHSVQLQWLRMLGMYSPASNIAIAQTLHSVAFTERGTPTP
jgi:hypothetical protein